MPQKVAEISPSVTKGTGWVHWRYCLFNNPKFPEDKELRLVMEDFSIILKLHLLIYFFFFSWLTIKDFWWKAFAWNTLKISGIAKDLLAVTRLMLGSAAEEREKMQINPLTPTISY